MISKKVILCYPPERKYRGWGQDKRWLPLGIASIGAYLQEKFPNLEIVLLDLFRYSVNEAVAEVSKHIDTSKTNYVGYTVFTEQRFSTWELSSKLKHKYGKSIINVVGGAHAFAMSNQIADNYDFIDIVIRGEGEKAWEDIINNSTHLRIINSENVNNLDDLPFPLKAFKLFKNTNNVLEAEAPILFSRGCTDCCSFCSTTYFWKGYRSRSAISVYNEMLEYNRIYGSTKFKFHDDASTGNIEEWKVLCRLIIENGHKWEYEITARADHFDDELIHLLKQSGCHTVALGIESGSETMRNAMNKKLDIEKAKINMAKIKQAGITLVMLMIVAYPNETEETIEETIELLQEVKPHKANFMPLMVLPATNIYRDCVNWGWIDDNYWLQDQPQPYYVRERTAEKITEWVRKLAKFNDYRKNNLNCNNGPKKVLLCAPIHEDKKIFELYLKHIRLLEVPQNVKLDTYFILHNSENLQNCLEPFDRFEIYNNTSKYKKDEITHYWERENFSDVVKMKNKLMDIAYRENYDYIFYVDSDLMLHNKTLVTLLNANKHMIAQIFWTDWNNTGDELPNCWNADHYAFSEGEISKWKNEKGSFRVGMTGACTLISKELFRHPCVNWNPIYNMSNSVWEDRAFCTRVACAGAEIWINTEFPALHIYRTSILEKFIKDGAINE